MNNGERIWCVLSEEMLFTPHMVPQNLKFHISLNNFVETLPRSMHDFFLLLLLGAGGESDVFCHRFLLPYSPMLTKPNKNLKVKNI